MSDDTVVTASDPGTYTITLLGDGRVLIQADCNRAMGTYTLSGAQLTIQVGPTTLAACPPGSQGTVFLRTLNEVATFVLRGEELTLSLKVDSGNMVFAARPAASLTGSEWRVTGYNNGVGGVTSVVGNWGEAVGRSSYLVIGA